MSLSDIFDKVHEDNRVAFIGYYPVGFLTIGKPIENIKAIIDASADIVEVGLPFSGPTVGGPIIQDAANVAPDVGFHTHETMRVVREATKHGDTCMVMSYWNPILQCGPERFAEDLAAAGGRGAITPNLIPEEASQWQRAVEVNDLFNIMLVAPSSTNEHLQLTATASTGFVCVTSHISITGAQTSVDSAIGRLVARTHEVTDTLVRVGLSVSNGERAAETAESIDGVIVGSVLIRAAMKDIGDLVALTRELVAGIRGES